MTKRGVACYRSDNGTVVLLPVAYDPKGRLGTQINRPAIIGTDSEVGLIGRTIRDRLDSCDLTLVDPTAKLPQCAVGARSYSQFAKRHQLVEVSFTEVVTVTPTTRDSTGTYWHLPKQAVQLPAEASDAALGQAVWDAFSNCREGKRMPDEA